MTGIGRVLVIVYAIMALGATGRSFVQIVERFDEAPLAYTLSALSALVYIVATLALVFAGSRGWYVVAWVAIVFELVGVLVVGTLSFVMPELFAHPTVWSWFGSGYLFVPLALTFQGLWWLATHRPVAQPTASSPAAAIMTGTRTRNRTFRKFAIDHRTFWPMENPTGRWRKAVPSLSARAPLSDIAGNVNRPCASR